MVLFLTALLVLSSLGMLLILILKRYELNTGHVLFEEMRPKVGGFFTRNLIWIEEALPSLFSEGAGRAYRYVRGKIERGAAFAVIFLEQGLIRVLRSIRKSTSAPKMSDTEASPFLREVAEHKKKILEEKSE